MKNENSLLNQLIQAFKILPGIGEKSAQRMAFHLLEKNSEGGKNLAKLINESVENIRNCTECQTLQKKLYVISVQMKNEAKKLFVLLRVQQMF